MTQQGPVYVGTGCMFRRLALYGFDPPQPEKFAGKTDFETEALRPADYDHELDMNLLPKRFGNSTMLAESIPIAEYQGRPLADHPTVKYGRPPGALRVPREPLDAAAVAEAVSVISCWYASHLDSCQIAYANVLACKSDAIMHDVSYWTGMRTRQNGVTGWDGFMAQ
jgi:hypothetical protein